MATIKAYTDISQSKKLAEILPKESADMGYLWNGTSFCEYPACKQTIFKRVENIPCWSLAALVDVLPRSIEFKDDKYYLRFMKEYVEYANDEISITGRCLHTTSNNNLIDACYEMIIRLHELNLL